MPALASILLIGSAVVSSHAVEERVRFRLDAGLNRLRTPIVDGLEQRGPAIGAGIEYAFAPGYSAIWSAGLGRLSHDDGGPIDGNDQLTVASSMVGLRVVPFNDRARVAPYVVAGVGLTRTRWQNSPPVHLVEDAETAWSIPLIAGIQWRPRPDRVTALFVEAKHEFTGTRHLFPNGMEWWGLRLGIALGRR